MTQAWIVMRVEDGRVPDVEVVAAFATHDEADAYTRAHPVLGYGYEVVGPVPFGLAAMVQSA